MSNLKIAQLESWLKVLCQMLPGIGQAVLITDSCAEGDNTIRWPSACEIDDDVMSAAGLAASQNKSVTTTLSSSQVTDSAVDMIISLPLTKAADFTGTLAILVNIKPSQQSVVMQILQWGQDWLGLLSNQPQASGQMPNKVDAPEKTSLWQSARSRLVVIALVLVVVAMSIVTGNYRVTAPANLEGKIQRVIVAPFDGYIATANARAGESVAIGDVIARMDTDELALQQQRYAAEKNEVTRQYRQALSVRDQAQAHIFKSQISQADAQLRLLNKKIQRSHLVSTLDGVIISGDLSRSLGAPVKTGDVLFEVAPLDEYRLIISVDEKQVADVQAGRQGLLMLKALPDESMPFIVTRVSPVFEKNETGIAYRVEAQLVDENATLRPGMQGVAKIDIEQRSYLWIYLHELFDVIRLWAWRWLP